jgi:hypothetical protein
MNERNITKPVTLLKEDFLKSLVELCNNSGLPFFIVEYILKDVYLEVKMLAQKQYESDLMNYNKSNKNEQPIKLVNNEG